jgi:gamma-glutamylcyclotransferase (GGCT)/AIG2-like uncharacterized protein YtfP
MSELFVYGTLKRGQRRNFYLTENGASFLREARTAPRYRLLRSFFADYPCLVEDGEKGVSVEGELWDVPEQTLADVLDPMEGVPRLFVRTTVVLDGEEEAVAYLSAARPLFAWDAGTRWGG